jgi:hypothetical protein
MLREKGSDGLRVGTLRGVDQALVIASGAQDTGGRETEQ